MSLNFLNTAMIEQPASIFQLSAGNLQSTSLTSTFAEILNLKATSLTALDLKVDTITDIQSINNDLNVLGVIYDLSGNSTQWSQVFNFVQANSAFWEETNDILPTVLNYLSTNAVTLYALNTLENILSGNNDLANIFTTNTFLNPLTGGWESTYTTVNSLTSRYNNASTVVENTSSYWDNTALTFGQLSGDILNNKTTVADNSSNWQEVYTQFGLISAQYAEEYTVVTQNSGSWGLGGNAYTTVLSNSGNWNSAYSSAVVLSSIVLNNQTVLTQNSATWQTALDTTTTVAANSGLWNNAYDASTLLSQSSSNWNQTNSVVTQSSGNWNSAYSSAIALSGIVLNNNTTLTQNSAIWNIALNTRTTLTANSGFWDQAYNTSTLLAQNSSNWNLSYLEVLNNSQNWNTAYFAISSLSAITNNNQTVLSQNSGNWNFAYNIASITTQASSTWNEAWINSTYILQNSGVWTDTYTTVSNNSGKYENTYSVVSLNSANWEDTAEILPTILTHLSTNNTVISSLQGINNNLHIVGDLTVAGSISALSALQITETTFLTGYVTLLSSLQVDGNVTTTNGSFVSGSTNLLDIFVKDSIFQPQANNWDNTTTNVNSNSANWNTSYSAVVNVLPGLSTIVNSNSANWNNSYTTVNINSANWNNTYTAFNTTSATFISLTTAIQTNSADRVYIENNNIANALRIKQTGTGNAFVVETTGTELTPFIINTDGRIIAGHSTALQTQDYLADPIIPKIIIPGITTETSTLGLYSYATNDDEVSNLIFSRSTSNTIGLTGVVSKGTVLGSITWTGDDSERFITSSAIVGVVDQDVAVGEVPGGLSIRLLPLSGASVVERIYINSNGGININTQTPVAVTSSGKVGIGTADPTHELTVVGNVSVSGNAIVNNLTTQNITITSGNVFSNTTLNNLVSALAITVNGTTLYLPLLSAI